MFQIFLKPSIINKSNWRVAYEKICSIVSHFPTKLYRLESYNGFSPELDKKHLDVIVDKDSEQEHLSFYGDWMSYTGGRNVRFYKNWKQQLANASYYKEIDENKPAAWFPHKDYQNDGSVPEANGILPHTYYYMDTGGAHQICALMAIGTMLENLFKDDGFMVVWEETEDTVKAVVNWLEDHFQESFDYPVYFDKPRLLHILLSAYPNKKEVARRFAHLYRNKHKQNMDFLVKHLGYDATFEFYSEVLGNTTFGTFGFNDVLMPWIAVAKDLEDIIDFVLASKNWLLQDPSNTRNLEAAAKYDLTYILKQLLNNYILWTPEQREQLAHFYTNEKALETGKEDLFGIMKRMMGYRVDICPIYSTKDELFESFMYKEPKKGKVFKEIIDKWIVENKEKYEDLKEQLEVSFQKVMNSPKPEQEDKQLIENIELQNLIDNFVLGFKPSEQYFVRAAVTLNPSYIQLPAAIDELKQMVLEVINGENHQSYVEQVRNNSKAKNITFIKYRIKEISYAVHPNFETWLTEANNDQVLFYLHFLMALKLYKRKGHFVRSQILWDRGCWVDWD